MVDHHQFTPAVAATVTCGAGPQCFGHQQQGQDAHGDLTETIGMV